MKVLFILFAHFLVTVARLARPGGVRAIAAESLAVKHQLRIMKRSQRRCPKLTPWDRVILGFCTLLLSPRRVARMAVILKTSTLLGLHRALVKRKYRLLYSPRRRGRRPGPKGPSRELINAVLEMKLRNPLFGFRKIAEQICNAFGVELNKDVVRRILAGHYRPRPDGRPCWLAAIGNARDRLWSVDLFRSESILLQSYWVMVVMDVFTRRIIGFSVAPANLDGIRVCQMFNRAIASQALSRHLSSDNDPLFRFQRWRANLRVLEVDEIKTIPRIPRSHAFVERLVGTIRREYLDRIWFWGQSDLERKLQAFQTYYNQHRCHTGLSGLTPARRSGAPAPPFAHLNSYRWQQHCNGLFQTPIAA